MDRDTSTIKTLVILSKDYLPLGEWGQGKKNMKSALRKCDVLWKFRAELSHREERKLGE